MGKEVVEVLGAVGDNDVETRKVIHGTGSPLTSRPSGIPQAEELEISFSHEDPTGSLANFRRCIEDDPHDDFPSPASTQVPSAAGGAFGCRLVRPTAARKAVAPMARAVMRIRFTRGTIVSGSPLAVGRDRRSVDGTVPLRFASAPDFVRAPRPSEVR
jgi:hypothetical protein